MSSRRALLFVFGILGSAGATQGLVACSGDDSTPATPKDAAADHTAAPDTSTQTSDCNGDVPVMFILDESGNKADPDWSCYAQADAGFLALDDGGDEASDDAGGLDASDDAADASAPDGDAGEADASDAAAEAGSEARTFQLQDFASHALIPNTPVDLFYSRSAAGNPDFTGTTDDAGNFSFTPPATSPLLAYRVNAQDAGSTKALITSIQYDNVIPKPGSTLVGNSLTTGELSLILSGVLGSQTVTKGSTILVSGARDCKAREVGGAVLTLLDGETNQPVAVGKSQGEVHADYFYAGFPNETCTYTNATQSVWSAINVPANMPGKTHKYIVQFSGRKDASQASPVVMGQVELELWPDAVIAARPYRLSPP